MGVNSIKSKLPKFFFYGLLLFVVGCLNPTSSQAQNNWPPFLLSITPTYEEGNITYALVFVSLLEPGAMADVSIHVPLPKGTRYVEGGAQESTEVSFDGQEVKFFTAMLARNAMSRAYFTVEVVDSEQVIFVSQPWVNWQGQQLRDYLADPVMINITRQTVDWDKPVLKHMLLEASATVDGDIITYHLFPSTITGRVWDATVKLPIPTGATFLSAEASPPFNASFDGKEATFEALELAKGSTPLLQVKVSTAGATEPALVTHGWVSFRNVGFLTGHFVPPKDNTRTGDIIVQPHATGWVIADDLGDVPFANYDVTSLAAYDAGNAVNVIFYTRDEIGPIGQPLIFGFYLNTNCQFERDYRILYNHGDGQAFIQRWNADTVDWEQTRPITANHIGPRMLAVQIPKSLIKEELAVFCGIGRIINASPDYSELLEIDAVPGSSDPGLWLTLDLLDVVTEEKVNLYEALGIIWREGLDLPQIPTHQVSFNLGNAALLSASSVRANYRDRLELDASDLRQIAQERAREQLQEQARQKTPARPALPATATPQPSVTAPVDLTGKLAIPLDNDFGVYDLHIFNLPTGQEVAHIPDAHQPDFRFDGQRLLFDREQTGGNFVYQYSLTDGSEQRISDAPANEHPVYDKLGGRVAYGNTGLTLGKAEIARDEEGRIALENTDFSFEFGFGIPLPDPILPRPTRVPREIEREFEFSTDLPFRVFPRRPFLFVQCSLQQPRDEADVRCQNLPNDGMLIPDTMGEIQGRYPVWVANDHIVYNGCDTWAGSAHCGMFSVPAASTRGFSDGIIPTLLTRESSDIPSDSAGGFIAFSSRRDGNWEAYLMHLDGNQVQNLSQSADSNDGLPTISPDGQWVAFISDRSGRWAVWVVPTASGRPTHLFDLPDESPWGEGDRAWYTERISWGPDTAIAPLTWEPAPTPDYQALYPTPVAPANVTSLPGLPATVEAQNTPQPTPTPTATRAAPVSTPTPTPTPKL